MPFLISCVVFFFTATAFGKEVYSGQNLVQKKGTIVLQLNSSLRLNLIPVEIKQFSPQEEDESGVAEESFIKYKVVHMVDSARQDTLGFYCDVFSSRDHKLSSVELASLIEVIGSVLLFPSEDWAGSPGSETRKVFEIKNKNSGNLRSAVVDMSNHSKFVQVDESGSILYETDDGDIRANVAYFHVPSWTNIPDLLEPLDLGRYELIKKLSASKVLVRKVVSLEVDTVLGEEFIEIDIDKLTSKQKSSKQQTQIRSTPISESFSVTQIKPIQLEPMNTGLTFVDATIAVPKGFVDIRKIKTDKKIPVRFLGTANSRDERDSDGDASTQLVFAFERSGTYTLQIAHNWIEKSSIDTAKKQTTNVYTTDVHCVAIAGSDTACCVEWDPLLLQTGSITLYQKQRLFVPICLAMLSRLSTQMSGPIGIAITRK